MQTFLCLRLFGPMVAWGEIAIGERRPAVAQPSRSGVLGLVAGALGLTRDDADALSDLEQGLGFGSCVSVRGELLVDYHTAQAPQGTDVRKARKNGNPMVTRKDELEAMQDGNAIQSWRTYFVDVVASACLWRTPRASRWTLEQLSEALRTPRFVPYLGRKSCPLGLPVDPQLGSSANPVDALRTAQFSVDALLGSRLVNASGPRTYRWEGAWDGLTAQQTVTRRDRVHSRARWQFAERQEHLFTEEGAARVPQPA